MRQDRFSLFRAVASATSNSTIPTRGSTFPLVRPANQTVIPHSSLSPSGCGTAYLIQPMEARRVRELLYFDLAISIIRSGPLSLDDVERIVRVLKDRELIQDATVGAGPVSEPLITFLECFWDYERSPYIRKKLPTVNGISTMSLR